MRIPLASNGLREKDIHAVMEVFRSGNLTMGSQVKHFEKLMSEYLNVKHFIMMNSGSSANLAIFEALLRPTQKTPFLSAGDGVLVPVIAWPTTIWPLIQLGLQPVFVDVDPETFALDLEKAQEIIHDKKHLIKGLFPIHPLGRAINPRALGKFASANDLVLVNDVCESLGSWNGQEHAGTVGLAASFSFYFSHHITTMEGGGVATNDADFADDLRSIRSHGWSRDRIDAAKWQANSTTNDSKFLFVGTGFNVRPMEIQAAIGISQISDIALFLQKRLNLAITVNTAIDGVGIRLVGEETLNDLESMKSHSWMLLPIQVVGENASQRKKRIVSQLESLGVETRPVLTGNFLSQPAMQRIGKNLPDPTSFSTANAISETTFLVSAHHELTDEQISFLCESLRAVARENL
jgi:CDP-6-deoxy-D-xylo-4-hexulose-3-dehydrase